MVHYDIGSLEQPCGYRADSIWIIFVDLIYYQDIADWYGLQAELSLLKLTKGLRMWATYWKYLRQDNLI